MPSPQSHQRIPTPLKATQNGQRQHPSSSMAERKAVPSEVARSKPPATHLHSQPPAVLLIVYPITLVLGSLYARISPTAYPPPSSSISSQVTPGPVNYFARKSNIFNIYFVKIGWFWTSLAFASLILTQLVFTGKRMPSECRLRRVGQALCRYLMVTFSWILVTQWCFGPPIIDRGFLATGGRCEVIQQEKLLDDLTGTEPNMGLILSSALCKASGGTWKGGHDVSGHAFMLVLASAFLVFEILGFGTGSTVSPLDDRNGKEKSHKSTDIQGAQNQSDDAQLYFTSLSQNIVWTVVGLSWWMLLMTGIWFHTWLEKMSGLVLALATIYLVYILPRSLSAWRGIIGIPGI